MNTLTLKVSDKLLREIALASRHHRISKSELMRRALQLYLAQQAQSALALAGDLVGSLKAGSADLSTNPKYLKGYGH